VILERNVLESAIFGSDDRRRFTQDSPVLPDVWLAYGARPGERQDLLLTPNRSTSSGRLSLALRNRLGEFRARRSELGGGEGGGGVAASQSTAAVALDLVEMVAVVLPMTSWWQRYVVGRGAEHLEALASPAGRKRLAALMSEEPGAFVRIVHRPGSNLARLGPAPELLWLLRIVGLLAWAAGRTRKARIPSSVTLVEHAARLLRQVLDPAREDRQLVWLVSLNRPAHRALYKSALAVKADAARRLFDLSCSHLNWGVIDSGIDASHLAFRRRRPGDGDGSTPAYYERPFELDDGRWENCTRVRATYDLTCARTVLDPANLDPDHPERLPERLRALVDGDGGAAAKKATRRHIAALRDHLADGREVDWALVEPLLEISHDDGYRDTGVPRHEHGTHVAGIIGADWERDDPDHPRIEGVCPDINLYDLRVLDGDGNGDEFNVIAALQFVRHVNARHDTVVIHGVNLSLSIAHDVANFACGRTPVCDECDRLVAAGVVVVAAAGNLGYVKYHTEDGPLPGYHTVSITDPGNADTVITVGATHRNRPHTYGVSYFSSRGPTGDGRVKPDLVAPGEKVVAPVPGDDSRRMDGTSMAAPHVSGAAALLMARHHELVGQPLRVKRVLCETATDLGRERYFQGCGMLDVLRALQAL